MTVRRSAVSLYMDAYKSFGWEPGGTENSPKARTVAERIVLKFKRDRKILNKAELTRLQRNFDACVNEI